VVDREIKNLRSGRTKGEQLWLWRMSRDLSQAQAAARLGLTPKQIWKMEADVKEYDVANKLRVPRTRGDEPPTLALLCRLARRRHGEGLYGTARLLGISHMTLLQRESRADPGLVATWEGLGYRF